MFEKCSRFSRFQSHFGAPVEHLIVRGGAARGVSCADGLEVSADAVCVCAGAWSSVLLSSWIEGKAGNRWRDAIIPRRGHLLRVQPQRAGGRKRRLLKHGIMESSYSKHYTSLRENNDRNHEEYDITFTATESHTENGTLLLGSSRELGDFDQTANPYAVQDIMRVARSYLPSLLDGSELLLETRVGLRPFSTTGPIVGPVDGAQDLYVAAGHEGSGLTLAPATANAILSFFV